MFLLVFVVFSLKNSFSQTTTIDFYPEKDNSMFSESINNSDGAGLYIFAGKTTQTTISLRRGLVKFNISSLPSNAIIENASLQLAVMRSSGNTTTPHSFAIHKVLQNWGEGTSSSLGTGAAAQGTDATWKYSLFNFLTQWTTLGGNFVATASASASVSYSDFPVNFGVWTGTQLNNDVSAWLSNPNSNFGWTIIGQENVSGSAKGFGSREQSGPFLAYRPKLTITYSLPVEEKILINEVNPQKKWIEIYNPSANAVNLANYYLVNGANVDNIGGGNITVLNGGLTLNAGKYVVINWTNLSQNTGEIAIFDKIPSNNTAIMKDYIQYGAANQSKAAAAVTAQVWNSATAFLPTITLNTNSFSLNPMGNFLSGKDTNSTSWLVQKETPSIKNDICPSNLSLAGNIVGASYQSVGQLKSTGTVSNISKIQLKSEQSILLENLFFVNNGATFEAKIGGCSN